ncbi:MAG: peptide-methionine (S)-S-oxide reductase [Micrococcales bacterium]|nr:peptide-methionine (S)-S-oxide reductase [Micrococcales bacterium]
MTEFVLAGGCFWCLDSSYSQFKGVIDVECGYSGGHKANPTYEEVCGEGTGHAEVAKVIFDESVISAELILDIFFTVHDPRQLNRQGNDIGTSYRSAMFYADDEQKALFEKALERAALVWDGLIVTELNKLEIFWPAEDYHQDYFTNNPGNAYCQSVVSGKMAKTRAAFLDYLK